MKLGLYRTTNSFLGECARIDQRAGDAAPFLMRKVYEAVNFQPCFNSLPLKDDYESRRTTRFAGRAIPLSERTLPG